MLIANVLRGVWFRLGQIICILADQARNVEEKARWAARRTVFEVFKYEHHITQAKNEALVTLYQDIETQSEMLKTEPASHSGIVDLTKRIDTVCDDPATLRYGWMMAGRIASSRSTPELSRFFKKYADMWLQAAPKLLSNATIGEEEVSAVPLMFYVIGDLDRAIDYGADMLKNTNFDCLTSERKALIGFNNAHF
jgi:hypothetical protein